MLAKTKKLIATTFIQPFFLNIITPEELDERMEDNILTKEEVEDGDFIDPIYGKCNIRKALRDRNEAVRREYEAFDLMHKHDGTLIKSSLSL